MAEADMGLEFHGRQAVPEWGSSGALTRSALFRDETDRISVAFSARTVGSFAPYIRSHVDFDLSYEEAKWLRDWLTDRVKLAEERKAKG